MAKILCVLPWPTREWTRRRMTTYDAHRRRMHRYISHRAAQPAEKYPRGRNFGTSDASDRYRNRRQLGFMRKRMIWHRHVISLGSAMVCMVLLVALPRLQAQGPAAIPTAGVTVPSYDVVSIKPDHSDTGRVSIHVDDGNLDALNVSLKMMILSAYNLKGAQLFGLPKWGDSAHFDIKAKVIDPDKKQLEALTSEQFESMQQPILTDRFQLKFHHEQKRLPVYELVVMKGGPKFKEATPAELKGEQGVGVHNRNMVATGVPISSLADQLSRKLQRVVVDKTGLTARSGRHGASRHLYGARRTTRRETPTRQGRD
jgi:uncharacterized protein (TIGR03435 family)